MATRIPGSPSGVSLLEVLIAIVVVLVGLVGVAAVIPVARLEMIQTLRADRAGACGRAILEMLKTSGAVNCERWCRYNGSGWQYVWPAINNADQDCLKYAYVLDPLFVGRNRTNDTDDSSMSKAAVFPCDDSGSLLGVQNLARRVSLPNVGGTGPMFRAVAERLNAWPDDLVIPVPDDPQQRPRQMMFDASTSTGFAYPIRLGDGVTAGTPMLRQTQGDYTWFATVVPQNVAFRFDATLNNWVSTCDAYEVAVAVVFKRDFSLFDATVASPNECYSTATFQGNGAGGGDVLLSVTDLKYASWLEVKENQWIVLVSPFVAATASTPPQPQKLKWYRVVSAGEIEPANTAAPQGPHQRYVTLAGPDWDVNSTNTAVAVVVQGVLGVYTSVVNTAP